MLKKRLHRIVAWSTICGLLLGSVTPVSVADSTAATMKLTVTKRITLNEGQKKKLKVTVKPKKLQSKLKFTSSNKNIVKVNKKGVITGVKEGSAKITVKVKKTKLKKTCKVIVNSVTASQATQIPAGIPAPDTSAGIPSGSVTPTATPTQAQEKPADKTTAKPEVTEPADKPTATPTDPAEKPVVTATPVTKPTDKPDATATPTAKPTNKPTATPTTKPTGIPTATPTSKPTATPTATPTSTPVLIVVSNANIRNSSFCEGENGGSGSYNSDSNSVECNLGVFEGIVLNVPAGGQFANNIIELSYTATGELNTYLYDDSYNGTRGQDDGSIEVEKLEASASDKTVRFTLGNGKKVKAVKLFNFTGPVTLKIKSLKSLGYKGSLPTTTPNPTATPTAKPSATNTAGPSGAPAPSGDPEFLPVKQFLEDETFLIPDENFNKKVSANRGTMTKIEYPSTVIKAGEIMMRHANVCLPKDYDSNKKYPVIYMMHGIFCNEDTLAGDNDPKDVLWNAIAAGVAEEAILVFPNGCANEYNGQGPYEGFSVEHYRGYDNFLNDFEQCLKPYIDSHYSTLTDRNNTAICGFSMGGRVTLHLGFKLQKYFRYVGAFCPAPGIFDFSDNGVTDTGLFTKDEFKLEDQYKDDTLVMIIKGANDGIVKQFPQDYHDALVDNNVPHIYRITNGGPTEEASGEHNGDVYNFGFYNFIKRIFKTTSSKPAPTQEPSPELKTTADISDSSFCEGENGGSGSYDQTSGCLESTLGTFNGIVLNVPSAGQFADNIVELTYTSTGELNSYLYDDSYTGVRGQDDGSIETDKLSAASGEAKARFTLGSGRTVKAIKLFNFSGSMTLKIKAMKVYSPAVIPDDSMDDYTKEVLTITMNDTRKHTVNGNTCTVDMQFYTGSADSSYFKGDMLKEGSTVIKRYKEGYNDGKTISTGRYILKGKDSKNNDCNIFIENNSLVYTDDSHIITKPTIITDSLDLAWLQTADVKGRVEDKGNGEKILHIMWNESNTSKIPYPAVKRPDMTLNYDKEIFTFNIGVGASDGVTGDDHASASMIYFSCEANTNEFKGTGVDNYNFADTRMQFKGQVQSLSARYILSGKDNEGKECRVYVENNGIDDNGMVTEPTIITDNPKWAWVETAPLHGTVGWEPGLTIHMCTTSDYVQ